MRIHPDEIARAADEILTAWYTGKDDHHHSAPMVAKDGAFKIGRDDQWCDAFPCDLEDLHLALEEFTKKHILPSMDRIWAQITHDPKHTNDPFEFPNSVYLCGASNGPLFRVRILGFYDRSDKFIGPMKSQNIDFYDIETDCFIKADVCFGLRFDIRIR